MNKHLKQALYVGLAALMLASTGVSMSTGYQANAAHRAKATKVYHHKNHRRNGKRKTIKRQGKVNHHKRSSRKAKVRKQNVKRYNQKAKHMNHRRHAKKRVRSKVLKSRFKRSNNQRALKKSGFFDANIIGGDFIFNKYAPNDKRAVVPKSYNGSNWFKGKFGQKNPTTYYYEPKLKGWVILK